MYSEKELKLNALRRYLKEYCNSTWNNIAEDGEFFVTENGKYLVLSDEEAQERAIEKLKETISECDSSVLSQYTGLSEETFLELEDNDEEILNLVTKSGRLEEFAEDVIEDTGRGFFLDSCDGLEIEVGGYYMYLVS